MTGVGQQTEKADGSARPARSGAPGEASPGPDRQRGGAARPAVLVGGIGVVLVGLILGLGVADLTSRDSGGSPEAAPPPSTTDAPAPAARSEPPPTTVAPSEPPATVAPSTAPPTTAAPATAVSTTTTARPVTTATSAPAATSTPSTIAEPEVTTTVAAPPPAIQVSYSQDGTGSLVVPQRAPATILLTNTGGTSGQFLLRATGPFQLSPSTGAVGAGQAIRISVSRVGGDGSGSITATVAPGNQFVIAVSAV